MRYTTDGTIARADEEIRNFKHFLINSMKVLPKFIGPIIILWWRVQPAETALVSC